MATLREFIEWLMKDSLVRKHLYDATSSQINPIEISHKDNTLILLWKSQKEPKHWLRDIKIRSNGLIRQAYFVRTFRNKPNKIVLQLSGLVDLLG